MSNNPSGIEPYEHNVLVKQEKVEARTKGGMWLPEQHVEREQHAATKCKVIALSPYAFEDYEQAKPNVADTVIIARHAGRVVEGLDGEEYRLVKDADIIGRYAEVQ